MEITGPAGAGKTTALRHLAEVLPPFAPVKFLDDQRLPATSELKTHLNLCGGPILLRVTPVASYQLAGWHEDEWLEYLLAVHPAA